MAFNSFTFAAFFLAIYALYLLVGRRLVLQNALLLIGSYFFYGWWDWRFLILIWLSTVFDYACGLWLDKRGSGVDGNGAASPYRYGPRIRKAILGVSVVSNLGMLGFFKYYDFFVESGVELLEALGLHANPPLLRVILPVGISFYTFQTLSYVIDVYRGTLRAERSLLNYAVFVAFFPQLVAGPILRAGEFLPQLASPRRIDLQRVYHGAYWLLWGLFKKVMVADNLATVVDGVFGDASANAPGCLVLVGVYAFAFQIYCDFSGYTDIARGCGRMMGFELPANFDLPYFAANPSDFWRRWHITLSTWFRDYVYIPLGGSRLGSARTSFNLMVTMTLCGLWHGAAWTFVIWGVYHGMLLVGHRLLRPSIERVSRRVPARFKPLERVLAIVVCFHLVCIGWLVFRADSLGQAAEMLGLSASSWIELGLGGVGVLRGTGLGLLALCVLPILVVQIAQYLWNDRDVVLRLPAFVRGAIYTAVIYGMILFGSPEDTPFIYFQF